MRQRTESQATVPATDRIVEVNEGTTSEVRNLMLEYTPKQTQETAEDATVIPAITQGGPVLEVGEVRAYLALQDVDGNTTGWIETKRGVDDIEESITLDQGERILRKRQKQNQYPGVGTRSRPRPMVEDVEDKDEHRLIEAPVEIEIDEDEPDALNKEKETEAEKWTKKRVPRKEREIQPGRKVPVQLRSEAEPEKMVNKILNQNIDGITVREVLGLSPDLLKELWGVKRFPALKGAAHVPATSGEKAQTDLPERHTHLIANRLTRGNERVLVEKHLYACASPMVMGKLEGAKRVKMLIDSGSEMCVMSKRLRDELQDELPIDRDVAWSIGSASATRDQVYGVCHSVSVNVGGVEVDVPIFVLEEAAQNLILGRPWERKVRAQYDNRDDGSLYITISTPDDQRRVVFCAVGKSDERNRDRARIQRHVTSATLEKEKEKEKEDVQGNDAGSRMRESASQ